MRRSRPLPLAAFTCLLACLLIPVHLEARQLTLEDYYRIVTVQAPMMSPDGRWVAFIRTAIVEADNRRHGELWIVPTDGSAAPRRISDPALNASGPRWSPDGRLLAFSGRRRGAPSDDAGGSIWFLRADRLDEPATQIKGVEGAPIFSPDNKWIAFTKRVAKPKARRRLAQAEPDAMLPPLAASLGAMSDVLVALSRPAEAAQAASEALTLLVPFVERYPDVFGETARAVRDSLRRASAAAGQEPDATLLARAARALGDDDAAESE